MPYRFIYAVISPFIVLMFLLAVFNTASSENRSSSINAHDEPSSAVSALRVGAVSESRTDVNVTDFHARQTALIKAAILEHKDVVHTLLDASINVDVQNRSTDEALFSAAWHGHNDIVQKLLDEGADVAKQGHYGYTALTGAASNGHSDVVRTLMEAVVDVDARNRHGAIALLLAAWYGHDDTVHTLLDLGVHADETSSDFLTVYVSLDIDANGMPDYQYSGVTCMVGWDAVLGVKRALEAVEQGNVVRWGQSFWERDPTAINLATSKGHKEIVRTLLDGGANLQGRKYHAPPLGVAAAHGHHGIVQMLLDEGADVHRLVLEIAVISGQSGVVRTLLQAVEDVAERKRHEAFSLHLAAQFGEHDTVRTLLNMEINVDAQIDPHKQTSLMAAAYSDHRDIVRMLLDAGANIDLQDAGGTSALEWAREWEHYDIVRMLQDAGAEDDIISFDVDIEGILFKLLGVLEMVGIHAWGVFLALVIGIGAVGTILIRRLVAFVHRRTRALH